MFHKSLIDRLVLPFTWFSLGVVLAAMPAVRDGENRQQLQDLVAKVEKAAKDQRSNLCSYSVIQDYTLQNKHLATGAQMKVRVTYERNKGKRYQILSLKAEGIARRSLQQLVKAEAQTSASKQSNAVNSSNYRFRMLGEESCGKQSCYKLALIPRYKRKDLVDGTAWVSKQDYHLVRIAGHLAKSPSFWISRPEVEQRFEMVDGFSMPSYNRSSTHILFLGEADLAVAYSGYQVQRCKN